MASDRDRWADNLSGENSGGWLTAFLADEDDFDRRALWRLGSWGVGTVGVVVVALLANQYAIGWRQEQVASADLVRQSQQIQRIAKESQNETRRLASAVDTLNSDRDRLYSRVTVLEQGLESVTGSIGRQNTAAASAPATSTPSVTAPSSASAPSASTSSTPTAAPPPAADPPAAELIGPPAPATTAQTSSPPPAMTGSKAAAAAAPAATAGADKPSGSSASLSPEPPAAAVAPASQPAASARTEETSNAASAAAVTAPASASAAPTAPLMATKSMLSPPDPAAAKLIEATPSGQTLPPLPPPQIIAAAPGMTEPDAAGNQVPAVAVPRTEFGVDLGGANSIEGLRALWRGLIKNRSNKLFADLRPIIVVKERSNGLGMQLRLVAGPINDAATAAKLCAGLIETSRSCETTVFDGQRLALKNDNAAKGDSSTAAPSARPAAISTRSLRKRGNASGAANGSANVGGANGAKVEEPPAETSPPAKSSLTSILGLR